MERALVYGVAIAGRAVVRGLLRRGVHVVAADDAVNDEARAFALEMGIELVASPDQATIGSLVRDCSFVAPAPGVPETHAVILAALEFNKPLRTEIDLA